MVTKKNTRSTSSTRPKKAPAAKKAAGMQQASGVKKSTKKPLLKAPSEHAFYCIDGRLFYDLRELAEGMMAMNEQAFFHHVCNGNNDFRNWVRDVIQDIELANDLDGTTNKDESTTYIMARLDYYE